MNLTKHFRLAAEYNHYERLTHYEHPALKWGGKRIKRFDGAIFYCRKAWPRYDYSEEAILVIYHQNNPQRTFYAFSHDFSLTPSETVPIL